jgi:uncharacterized membrane protein
MRAVQTGRQYIPVVFTPTKKRPSNDGSLFFIAVSHVSASIMLMFYQIALRQGSPFKMMASENDRRTAPERPV